jgi:hypothetical protein
MAIYMLVFTVYYLNNPKFSNNHNLQCIFRVLEACTFHVIMQCLTNWLASTFLPPKWEATWFVVYHMTNVQLSHWFIENGTISHGAISTLYDPFSWTMNDRAQSHFYSFWLYSSEGNQPPLEWSSRIITCKTWSSGSTL